MKTENTEVPNPRLFPDNKHQRAVELMLSERLNESSKRVQLGKVSPTIDIDSFRKELSARSFDTPEDLPALLEWTITHLENGLVQMTHPRYFGLLNPAPTFPSICADQVAAAFNPQICVWSHAPVVVENCTSARYWKMRRPPYSHRRQRTDGY